MSLGLSPWYRAQGSKFIWDLLQQSPFRHFSRSWMSVSEKGSRNGLWDSGAMRMTHETGNAISLKARSIRTNIGVGNYARILACESSRDPSAVVAVQLNPSVEYLTGKLTESALDPEVMTTRFLIQGGVSLLNASPMISIPDAVQFNLS